MRFEILGLETGEIKRKEAKTCEKKTSIDTSSQATAPEDNMEVFAEAKAARVDKEIAELSNIESAPDTKQKKRSLAKAVVAISVLLVLLSATGAMAGEYHKSGREKEITPIQMIEKNPERANKIFEQMQQFHANVLSERGLDKLIQSLRVRSFLGRSKANNIINTIWFKKHMPYLRGEFSRAEYRQYLNDMNVKYGGAFNADALLNLRQGEK